MDSNVDDVDSKGKAEERTARRPEGWFEGWIKGWPEGWAKQEIAVARRALALGWSIEAASRTADLPVNVVRKLAKPETEEGVWAEGWARGRAKVKIATVLQALALDCSIEVASKVADLPLEAVREIADLKRECAGASL
ncbi:MAG: hypothetical protein K6E40_12090 [Desulfovibrio sp.]|nr:hypothetical protein [Desulfovibrio sp.]